MNKPDKHLHTITTIDYVSSILYSSPLLSTNKVFRVIVKKDNPPDEYAVRYNTAMKELEYTTSPPSWTIWPHVKELIIEAPTAVIAYITVLDLRYDILSIEEYTPFNPYRI